MLPTKLTWVINKKICLGMQVSKSALWERPGCLTNSQLTTSTQRLSQNTLFSPGNLREAKSHQLNHSKDQETGQDSFVDEYFGDCSKNSSDTSITVDWIEPYHTLNHSTQPRSDFTRALDLFSLQSDNVMASRVEFDELARKYFPVTLSSAWETRKIEDSLVQKYPMSQRLPTKGLPLPDSAPWITANPKSPTNKKTRSEHKTRVENEHYMRADAPTTSAATVLATSPYQVDLARLRLQRLRLEEEFLLEVKRQEELERIRGPSPKWYELKTPNFHYEYQKNDKLLKNEEKWQALLDYRRELEEASSKFHQQHFSATA